MLRHHHRILVRAALLLGLLAFVGCGKSTSKPVASNTGFISQPNLFAVAGEAYDYRSRISLIESSETAYELVQAPEGMSVDVDLGDLLWTPTMDQGGAHDVFIRAVTNGEVAEQSFELQVGVPRLVGEKEITSAGGVLDSGDLIVTFPAGSVDAPTGFSLYVLEEGTPPFWEEMTGLALPFILRSSDSSVTSLPVQISIRAKAPEGALVHLARGTAESRAGTSGSEVDVVVLGDTAAGPTESQITADLTELEADYIDLTASWLSFTYLFAEIFDADGFTLVWAYNEIAIEGVDARAAKLLADFSAAKAAATGSMGCTAPNELVIYVATFKASAGALGFAWSQKVFMNKEMMRSKSAASTRDTVGHEYFHIIQGHILNGASSGWVAEPTAEFAAGQIFNENLSHTSFGTLGPDLTRLGLAPVSGAATDFHKYQLYLYFRYLRENTSWRVCNFYASQSAALSSGGVYSALSASLGVVEASRTYLDFVEAYFFNRSTAAFGDDATGIGSWEPPTLNLGSSEVKHEEASLQGGVGVKVKRSSSESQNISIALSGSMASGASLPMTSIMDESMTELADLFGSDNSAIVLKDVSSPSLSVTVAQGLLNLHPTGKALTITVAPFELVITNESGTETSEDGQSVTFDVALSATPGNETFVFSVVPSEPLEAWVDLASLSFTKDNWEMPQTVTITGIDDTVKDEDVMYTVDLSATSPTGWDITESLELTNKKAEPYVVGLGTSSTTIYYDGTAFSFALPGGYNGQVDPESYFATHMGEYDMYLNGVAGHIVINIGKGINGNGNGDFVYTWDSDNLPSYLSNAATFLMVYKRNSSFGIEFELEGADLNHMKDGGVFSFEAKNTADASQSYTFDISIPNSTITAPGNYASEVFRFTNTVNKFFKNLTGDAQYEVN